MREKEITITNKETGEQTTGNITDLARSTGINRKTLTRWIQMGHSNNVKWDIQTGDDTTKSSNGTSESSNGTFTGQNEPAKNPNGTSQPMQTRPEQPTQEQTYTKTIIPSGPCIYCAENVYHTAIVEGKRQFVCFGKCEPITHNHEGKRTMLPSILKSIVNI